MKIESLALLIPLLTVLPREVQKFVEQRDSCGHFRGEVPDPEERERMREVVFKSKDFAEVPTKSWLLLRSIGAALSFCDVWRNMNRRSNRNASLPLARGVSPGLIIAVSRVA